MTAGGSEIAKKKERIAWLDQLRGLSFFLIVLGHVSLPANIVKFIYSFHMPLFFMISGMTFNPVRYDTLGARAKDKFKKLMLPHLWMNLAVFPLWIFTWKVLASSSADFWTLLKGIVYINSGKYQSPSNATYFLAVLFIVDILFYLVYRFSKGDSRYITVLVLIIGLAGFIESKNASNYNGPWHIEASLTAIVFFMLGYFLMQKWNRIQRFLSVPRNLFVTLCCLLVAGIWCSLENGRVSFNGNNYDSIIYFYVAAISLSLVVIFIVAKLPTAKIFTFIGQNTLIYVGFHIPMIRLFQKLFPIFTSRIRYEALLAVIVYLLMILVVMLINNFFPYIVSKQWNFKTQSGRYVRIGISMAGIILWIVSMILLLPLSF